MKPTAHSVAVLALSLFLPALAGCPSEELEIEIERDDRVIVEDPATDVVLLPEATIVEDVTLIPVEVLPDVTVLTFENFTDYEIVISYFVDGFPEAVLVPFGQDVSIAYEPCVFEVQLDFEDDFDPVSGLYVGSFDLFDILLIEGIDYFCGDEIIFTFEPDIIFITALPL